MNEETIVKSFIILLLTLMFGVIGWGLAWMLGLAWSWWLLIIIYIFTFKVFN